MNHCHHSQDAYLKAFHVCMFGQFHMQQRQFQIHVGSILQSEFSNEMPTIDTYPKREGELLGIHSVLFMGY